MWIFISYEQKASSDDNTFQQIIKEIPLYRCLSKSGATSMTKKYFRYIVTYYVGVKQS